MTSWQPSDDRHLDHPTPRRARSLTPVAAGLGAVSVVTVIVLTAGAGALLSRPLWLDEVVTQLVAIAPRGILHALRAGVDFQPPPHYWLVKVATVLGGGPTSTTARAPSVLAALLTVFTAAATLRATVSLPAALAGALALAAHPLFVAQAFEGRPYALWILASALTAESLRENRDRRAWLVAAAAVALAVTHYFGVLSLAAVGIGALVHATLTRRAGAAAIARSVAPLAIGGLALLLLLPLAQAQLAATGGRSWVAPATPDDIRFFLAFPWGWHPALWLMLAGVLTVVGRRVAWIANVLPRRIAPLGVTDAALLATALVPVFVVFVSVAYKPVLVLRYSAPAVLAVAALCAYSVERFPPVIRWAAVALLVRATYLSFHSASLGAREAETQFAQEAQLIRALAARGTPTVSPFRHDSYRQSLPANRGEHVTWIELPDSLLERAGRAQIAGMSRDLLSVERDFGRAVHAELQFPGLVSLDAVRGAPEVALLRDPSLAAADSLWLPGRSACALRPDLVIHSRPENSASCAALRAAVQSAPSRR
ncbi:MAG: glycosyltransferase family 39 protein [Gemmatimonadetes bacterium]|nr:glycosyltransferase family 39 protein [Gemmatimonadota bacterium]